MDTLTMLEAIAEPMDRAVAVSHAIEEQQALGLRLAALRRTTLEELIASGVSQSEIAKSLGISRSRVSAMLVQGHRPERAFFGADAITIAVAGKVEAGRSKVVVSDAAMRAAYALRDAVKDLGLKSEQEVIPPPGDVDLNRPGLVVVAGPRLLPFVRQMVSADGQAQFALEGEEWVLKDLNSGQDYRSLGDGAELDYGFIGRVSRPDQKGTFLHVAGIHAEGTHAACTYLLEHLADLHRETKGRKFAQLVSVDASGRITPASPVYKEK